MVSKCTFVSVALLLTVLLLPACAQTLTRENLANENVPAAKKDCTLCHLSPDGKKIAGLKAPLETLCIDCHADRKAPLDHGIGISPASQRVKLPLVGGKMTCVTCHDPHRNPYRAMLRLAPRDLCQNCHTR